MNCEAVFQLDLCVYAGDTFVFEIEWLDEDGQPINNTNYTALMQARKTRKSTTALFSKTQTSGINLQGSNGIVQVTLDPADTNQASTKNVWDIELISPTGVVTTLATGTFIVTKDVSRV